MTILMFIFLLAVVSGSLVQSDWVWNFKQFECVIQFFDKNV